MSNVKWTKTALDDLDGLKEYIAKDSVHYAEKFENDAFTMADNLKSPISLLVPPSHN